MHGQFGTDDSDTDSSIQDISVQDSSVYGQFATYYIPLSLDENCFHLVLIGN